MSSAFDSPSGQAPLAIEVAELFPRQGQWRASDYLALTDRTRRLVELVDGAVEVLPVPTESHQLIVQYLFLALHRFLSERGSGIALFAPIRVQTLAERFREPDLAVLVDASDPRRGERYWGGADLVMEVASEDPASRSRDLEIKREEYARAGIHEYWIVDPRDRRVTVLRLAGQAFEVWAEITSDGEATSPLLDGLRIRLNDLFQGRNPGGR